MVALAASDVTVTVQKTVIQGKLRRARCKIAFANGTLTYPASGVPLPSASSFGMKTRLDYIILTDPNDGSGYQWKYDQENHKLRCWIGDNDGGADGPSVELGAVAVATSQVLYCEAVGW